MPTLATSDTPPMLPVDLLVVPHAAASTLLGMFDVLSSVGRDWELMTGDGNASPRIRPRLVSLTGGDVQVLNNVHIRTHARLVDATDASLILVPDLMIDPEATIVGQHQEEVAWLKERYASNAIVASVCSGSLLLAEAGLLENCEATTHWAFCNVFARDYPNVRLYPERVLVASGDGLRVITGGGGSSWHDLLLYLISRFIGHEHAFRLAKLYLLQPHTEGQLPYARITISSRHEDKVISEIQNWIAFNYHIENPVSEMVQRSGLSERTFKRRFKDATGHTPLEYIHNLRVEEAKQMLEQGLSSVEAIAHEVGYEDGTFFRRLFKRKTGMTAFAYRRKFLSLGRLQPSHKK